MESVALIDCRCCPSSAWIPLPILASRSDPTGFQVGCGSRKRVVAGGWNRFDDMERFAVPDPEATREVEKELDMSLIRLTAPAVLCLASVAHADFDLQWDGMLAQEQVFYSVDASVSWDSAARERNQFAFAGILEMNGGDFNLVCIELAQEATSESVPYAKSPFEIGDADYGRSLVLSSLFSTSFDDVILSGSAAKAAAFAMLTWEIMTENFDGGPESIKDEVDLELGAVQFGDYSDEAAVEFESMRSQLTVATDSSNLITYRNADHQDFAGQVPGPGALGLFAASAILGRRRRRA